MCLKFWKTSQWPVQLTAEIWRGHEWSEEEECWEFISFFCFVFVRLLPLDSFILGALFEKWMFRWQMAWMHIEIAGASASGRIVLSWATENETLHLPRNSPGDCIYTHAHAKTHDKRDTVAFFFLFLFTFFKKRTIKYIKTYLQCVCFCFGQKTNKQIQQQKQPVINSCPVLQVFLRSCAPVSCHYSLSQVQ